MSVQVPLDAYTMDGRAAPDVSRERELAARDALKGYEGDLAVRFQDGGDYDTYKIATGETFVEIVCGGYMNGFLAVKCYESLTAVQLFIDAMERYFATVPAGKVLHWHTRPEWKSSLIEESDRWYFESGEHKDYHFMRTIYNIYARLVLR